MTTRPPRASTKGDGKRPRHRGATQGEKPERAERALVNAIRDVDLVTELDQDRFLVLLPYTDRAVGAEVARRIISAGAAADPVVAAGRTFSPRLIGAVAVARPGEAVSFAALVHDATQLLEQATATGASLAVET